MALTVWIIATVILLYRMYKICYNLFLHPLSKVPGPWLSAISWFPKVWRNMILGIHWSYLRTLHEQYGPVVRVGPDEISFTSAIAWDDIQGRKAGKGEFIRDPNFFIVTQIDERDSLLSNVREEHDFIRRLMSPAFSDKAMVRQEQVILEWGDKFLDSLHRRAASPIDLAETYVWTTFDMMGDLAFGEPFGCLENDRSHRFLNLVSQGLPYLSVLQILLRFDITRVFYRTATKLPWMQSWLDSMEFTTEKSERRFERRADARPDVMTLIWNDAQEGNAPITRRQASQLANIFCVVGVETTATTLGGLTFWLLKTPHALAALTQELRAEREEDLTLRKLASLPYLNACITEGLRQHSAVTGPTPRLAPKGGAWVDGYFIPEGSVCGIPHWATSHVKRNFNEPDKFIPERWLPSGKEQFAGDDRKAFQPFGKGLSDCIGRQLALTEMRLVIAKLFFHFDVQLRSESSKWVAHEDACCRIFREKAPLWVDVQLASGL